MNAILICSNSLQVIKNQSSFGFVLDGDSLMYSSSNNTFLNVHYDSNIANHYEEEELEILYTVDFPRLFYYVDFNSFELFKQFVIQLGKGYLVDNDCGSVYESSDLESINSFNEFVGYN